MVCFLDAALAINFDKDKTKVLQINAIKFLVASVIINYMRNN